MQALRRHGLLDLGDTTWLEVGPGWAPTCAVVFHLAGVGRQWLYDKHRYFRTQYLHSMLMELSCHLDRIAAVCETEVATIRQRYERIEAAADLSVLAHWCDLAYQAPADALDSGLPGSSVDAVTTTLVLEHISRDVLRGLLREWRRVLKPGGLMSHIVDHSDHYSHFDRSISPVHFLKFSAPTWALLSSSLSYCNRLRECDYLAMFSEQGFEICHVASDTDPRALSAVASMSLAPEFCTISPRDLSITTSHIVAKKRI